MILYFDYLICSATSNIKATLWNMVLELLINSQQKFSTTKGERVLGKLKSGLRRTTSFSWFLKQNFWWANRMEPSFGIKSSLPFSHDLFNLKNLLSFFFISHLVANDVPFDDDDEHF